MNKKLLAVAVAGAFAAPAFAQTANNVVLYGRLNAGLDNAASTGAYLNTLTVNQNWKDRNRVWDTGSRLGVRGTEDLGNGLRAIFQIESGLNSNNGQATSEANQYNTSAGTLASRPTWVGLEGSWGNVKFGRQDVYWGGGTLEQTGANYVNTDIPWLTNNTGRVTAQTARQSNVLSYTSPTAGGVNDTISYSPDAGVSGSVNGASSQESAGPGKNTNAKLLANTIRGAWGPFQAQYDFVYKQNATDFSALGAQNAQGKVWAHKFLMAYAYVPGGQIAVIGTHIINANVTGADLLGAQTLKQDTLSVSWEHLLNGNILLMGQVGHQFNARGCDGQYIAGGPNGVVNGGIVGPTNYTQGCLHSGANALMAGVRYNLSKRTGVYVAWDHMQNQQNSFADYGGGAYALGSTVPSTSAAPGTLAAPGASGIGVSGKGSSITIYAVGIQHNF